MNPETRTYDKHWIPWTKRQLIAKGIKTETPLMPNPWEPVYEAFKKEFEKYQVSKDTILIGHSCGCSFLVRWLGDSKQEVKKLILVAPWKIHRGENKFKKTFYEFPIDHSIRSRVGKIVMFTANDEEEDGKLGLKMFHDVLGGEVVELTGKGHYVMEDMGTEEFPELIQAAVS